MPESVMTIKSPLKLEFPLESDWYFNLSIPKPPFQLHRLENEFSQRIRLGGNITFHVEKKALSSHSPASSSLLHEIGNLLPLSVDFVMRSLYWPLDTTEPERKKEPWLFERLFSKIEKIKSTLGIADIDMNILGLTTSTRVSSLINGRRAFPPPTVDRINLILGEDGHHDLLQGDLTPVAKTLPSDPENPTERTIHLNLGWLQSSMVNPLPWQTPEARQLVLMEILTHELSVIYQRTGLDSFMASQMLYYPPPAVLLRGISKFVTLQNGLSWTGVKTPDQMEEIPPVWNADSLHLAYFFLWIENVKYGRGSIASLNHHLSQQYYWSRYGPVVSKNDNGEAFWKKYLGSKSGGIRSLNQLWSEYLHYVAKEGYLSPLKWAHYSCKSPNSAPQGTVRWVSRVLNMIWRRICYWKRVAHNELHLQVVVTLRNHRATIMPWVTRFLLGVFTTIGYKIGYKRIFLTRIYFDNAEPQTILSAFVSLFWSGVRQSWHGVRLFASGIGVIWSSFCFPILHGISAAVQLEERLPVFVNWIFASIQGWIAAQLIDFVSWCIKWLLVSLGYLLDKLSILAVILLEIPLIAIKWWTRFVVRILSLILIIVARIIKWPVSFFSRSEINNNAPGPDVKDIIDDYTSSGTETPTSEAPSTPHNVHPPQVAHNVSSLLPSDFLKSADEPYIPQVARPSVTIQSPSPTIINSARLPSPSVESEIIGTELGEEEEEEEGLVAEEILRSRLYGRILKYRIKWRGMPADQRWYNARELRWQPDLLQDFHAQHPDQAGPPVRLADWFQAARNGLDPMIHADDNVARGSHYTPSRKRY